MFPCCLLSPLLLLEKNTIKLLSLFYTCLSCRTAQYLWECLKLRSLHPGGDNCHDMHVPKRGVVGMDCADPLYLLFDVVFKAEHRVFCDAA
jgi:hypothetical protein